MTTIQRQVEQLKEQITEIVQAFEKSSGCLVATVRVDHGDSIAGNEVSGVEVTFTSKT